MRTGPMTPALKARVLRNLPNNEPKTKDTVPPIEAEFVTPVEPPQPNQSVPIDGPSGGQRPQPAEDDVSDSLSFTSTLPDVFDVGMDDSAPPATGPWMIIDHFTGEMVVDEEVPPVIPTAPVAPSDSMIQTQVVLGVTVLAQTLPPALLFADQDERPNWLIRSTIEFLQHVPYYMNLRKVVDLFYVQEARLGYPEKVSEPLFFHILLKTIPNHHQSRRLALPCTNRPAQVAAFIKNARDFSCGDKIDVEKFGANVVQWWLTIQPTTRKSWPPSYGPLPAGFSFKYFNHGGPNGVFLVILCLSWWADALTPETDHTSFNLVVNDVRWVLEQVALHV